jgi:hypothetical protein
LLKTLLVNDTDVDGDTLSMASVQGAVGGTVALRQRGVHAGNQLQRPASLTIIDGNGGSSTATVNVAVTGGDAPVANTGRGLDPDQYPDWLALRCWPTHDVDGDTLSVTSATVDIRSGTVRSAERHLGLHPGQQLHWPVALILQASAMVQGGTASATVNVGNNTRRLAQNAGEPYLR